jgi:hypothetical protein
MIRFTGGSSYCYANSLHMCLQETGSDPWITPGLIACLGGMPFGAGFFQFDDQPMFFPSTPLVDPDRAVSQALWALGWACEETRAAEDQSTEEALQRLRAAFLPAQVGPLSNAWLTYHPYHPHLAGVDHYITVLKVGADYVQVHDPTDYPFATLPLSDFMRAWQASDINYGPNARSLAYVLRSHFRPVESLTQQNVLRRSVACLRETLQLSLTGPGAFSGPLAFHRAAAIIRNGRGNELREHLFRFSLPLGARGCVDGAMFLSASGEQASAACLERKAELYGAALYNTVHRHWQALADQFEQLAELEQSFLDTMSVNN